MTDSPRRGRRATALSAAAAAIGARGVLVDAAHRPAPDRWFGTPCGDTQPPSACSVSPLVGMPTYGPCWPKSEMRTSASVGLAASSASSVDAERLERTGAEALDRPGRRSTPRPAATPGRRRSGGRRPRCACRRSGTGRAAAPRARRDGPTRSGSPCGRLDLDDVGTELAEQLRRVRRRRSRHRSRAPAARPAPPSCVGKRRGKRRYHSPVPRHRRPRPRLTSR